VLDPRTERERDPSEIENTARPESPFLRKYPVAAR
jgi:hypothetical protein